jgi:hypothetical protein
MFTGFISKYKVTYEAKLPRIVQTSSFKMSSKASMPPKTVVLASIKSYIHALEKADCVEAYSKAMEAWKQVIKELDSDVYWPLFWEIQKEAFDKGFPVFNEHVKTKGNVLEALANGYKEAREAGYTAAPNVFSASCKTRIKEDEWKKACAAGYKKSREAFEAGMRRKCLLIQKIYESPSSD